ncbi:MAG TPA: hypothetical protein DCS19_01685 [Flavobacterium sp.]|nr:hypothetical protein [Flavobacterium sp.]
MKKSVKTGLIAVSFPIAVLLLFAIVYITNKEDFDAEDAKRSAENAKFESELIENIKSEFTKGVVDSVIYDGENETLTIQLKENDLNADYFANKTVLAAHFLIDPARYFYYYPSLKMVTVVAYYKNGTYESCMVLRSSLERFIGIEINKYNSLEQFKAGVYPILTANAVKYADKYISN